MKLCKCKNGHFYDKEKYARCPHCGKAKERFALQDERIRFYEPIDGQWRIDSLIGSGGFGTVYKIVNMVTLEKAALKVISINESDDSVLKKYAGNKSITLKCNEKTDNKIENIKREIHYLYEMHECKYFVHIYNDYQFQWEHGIDFMIQMELLTPITEYFRIHDVSEKELLKLGMHICKALICLEEKGIVHNDIKPSNVYRTNDGTYKLGDLGMSREIGALSPGGTMPYTAPEVLDSERISAQTDIYALGILLYILAKDDKEPIIDDKKRIQLKKPNNLCDEFFEVILKACEVSTEKRIKNATEMLEKLQKIAESVYGIITLCQETQQNIWEKYDVNTMGNENKQKRKVHKRVFGKQALYRLVNWFLFTFLLALMPMTIFLFLGACFKLNIEYKDKLITEMLYLGLTLSIMTIKDLAVSNLWKINRLIYILILFLSIAILVLTAIFFGIMTAKDMDLLKAAVTGTNFLLRITGFMVVINVIIGMCVQVLMTDE